MPEMSLAHLIIHEVLGEKERFLCCLFKNNKITFEELKKELNSCPQEMI